MVHAGMRIILCITSCPLLKKFHKKCDVTKCVPFKCAIWQIWNSFLKHIVTKMKVWKCNKYLEEALEESHSICIPALGHH